MVDPYRQKLHSSTTPQPPLPEHKIPLHSLVRIVASPNDDDQISERLATELKPTAILKWAEKDFIGSVADMHHHKSVYWSKYSHQRLVVIALARNSKAIYRRKNSAVSAEQSSWKVQVLIKKGPFHSR